MCSSARPFSPQVFATVSLLGRPLLAGLLLGGLLLGGEAHAEEPVGASAADRVEVVKGGEAAAPATAAADPPSAKASDEVEVPPIPADQLPATPRTAGAEADDGWPAGEGSDKQLTADDPTETALSAFVRTMLMLCLVVGLAYLTLNKGVGHLMKRAQQGRQVRVVERVPLDQRRALYLVEVEGRRMLLGSSEGGIARIADLDGEAAGPPKDFAESLGRASEEPRAEREDRSPLAARTSTEPA